MNNKGFIVDKRAKKFSGKKEQISITAEGRGVYITQLTHNLPQQLKFLRAEINLIKSEIEKGEYQTKYKKDLAEAKKQIETRKAEFEKTCEEKGITPEQAGRNLVNYAQDHFKTAEEQIAFLEELGGTNLVKDLEQPLKDATKEMFELYLFFNEQVGWPEGISEHSWVVFEPGMKLFYAAHTLSPVDFEFMLMKMRTEEKARMAYINKMNNYLSYDYDKEVKDYMKEHGEEVNKYLEKAFSKSSGSE